MRNLSNIPKWSINGSNNNEKYMQGDVVQHYGKLFYCLSDNTPVVISGSNAYVYHPDYLRDFFNDYISYQLKSTFSV